ncbi:hypothetical protein Gotri_005650, partial [Gossypium trilobum]|nr:hypothetical protein [Gossypium trilobum]
METIRFDIDKFDGIKNFNLWQVWMTSFLIQSNLEKKPACMDKLEWDRVDKKTLSMIQLCLTNNVLHEILLEKTETLIYGKDNLSFENGKGHLLRKDKLDIEFGSDMKLDRQTSILVTSRKRDKRCRYCKNSELTSEWILDSRCYFQMCPNKDWFSTYSSMEGGVERMRNDSSSKVIGIGTVQIRIHNEKIKTLSDVRHVHELKKNLICLGILDLKGCRINIESNGSKVSRGALVLIKGKKIGSLYVLKESMVIDETRRPSSIKELNSTRLKWRQLGHRKEKY